MEHFEQYRDDPKLIVVRFGDTELSSYEDPIRGIWGMSYSRYQSNATDAQKG